MVSIDYPIYVDFFRNMTFLLTRLTGEEAENKAFVKLINALDIELFYDVGANVGLYSFLFWTHRPGGTAILFEPDPYNAELIRKSLARTPGLKAVLIEKAVSDGKGRESFVTDDLSGATGSIAKTGARPFNQTHYGETKPNILLVETLSLDDAILVASTPQLVKIDVEGAERLVFAGAKKLLATHPAIMFEADPSFDLDPLHSLGYEIFDMSTLTRVSIATHNNLALHPERHRAAYELLFNHGM